jgi:apolipoprotein N-acyltransferase
MRKLPQFPKSVWAGFGFIYLAGLGWLADIIIPFTNLPHKALGFIIALSIAELSFIIGVALLGKAYYRKLKTRLLETLRSSNKFK